MPAQFCLPVSETMPMDAAAAFFVEPDDLLAVRGDDQPGQGASGGAFGRSVAGEPGRARPLPVARRFGGADRPPAAGRSRS